MKNRLIVDIYWCALFATWCCKTFTMIHAQNIVVQKFFVRAERGGCGRIPRIPLDPPLLQTEAQTQSPFVRFVVDLLLWICCHIIHNKLKQVEFEFETWGFVYVQLVMTEDNARLYVTICLCFPDNGKENLQNRRDQHVE